VRAPATTGGLNSWLRALRPKQWVKNVLVFAAPGSAGILFDGDELWRALGAFAVLSVAASGTYLLNDVVDADADRRHPTKRNRPIASGAIRPSTAVAVGFVLMSCAVGLAWLIAPLLAAVVGTYIVTTLSYSLALKHIAAIDIVTISIGFVLRALAGAAAVHVTISNWFFVVTTFGSLFMVTGKRLSEMGERNRGATEARAVLDDYTPAFLRYVLAVSSGAAILAYALWAFERAAESSSTVPWFQLSIAPFTTGFLHYALLLERGHGGAPEDLAFSDRTLEAVGAAWLALFALGLVTVS